MHLPYLQAMGAEVSLKGQSANILGPTELIGTRVKATDLRAGAAMVAAGLRVEKQQLQM